MVRFIHRTINATFRFGDGFAKFLIGQQDVAIATILSLVFYFPATMFILAVFAAPFFGTLVAPLIILAPFVVIIWLASQLSVKEIILAWATAIPTFVILWIMAFMQIKFFGLGIISEPANIATILTLGLYSLLAAFIGVYIKEEVFKI